MRYDRQAVLEMARGSTIPVSGTQRPAAGAVRMMKVRVIRLAPPKPAAVAPKSVVAAHPVPASHAAVPAVAHGGIAAKPLPVATVSSGPTVSAAPATQSDGTMVHHLTVAKDVPSTKSVATKPAVKKPVAKGSKKTVVKKAPAKDCGCFCAEARAGGRAMMDGRD